jgi:hypothetical protein
MGSEFLAFVEDALLAQAAVALRSTSRTSWIEIS